jgi:hypothetical protein
MTDGLSRYYSYPGPFCDEGMHLSYSAEDGQERMYRIGTACCVEFEYIYLYISCIIYYVIEEISPRSDLHGSTSDDDTASASV